jgi:hypothetical protein
MRKGASLGSKRSVTRSPCNPPPHSPDHGPPEDRLHTIPRPHRLDPAAPRAAACPAEVAGPGRTDQIDAITRARLPTVDPVELHAVELPSADRASWTGGSALRSADPGRLGP